MMSFIMVKESANLFSRWCRQKNLGAQKNYISSKCYLIFVSMLLLQYFVLLFV